MSSISQLQRNLLRVVNSGKGIKPGKQGRFSTVGVRKSKTHESETKKPKKCESSLKTARTELRGAESRLPLLAILLFYNDQATSFVQIPFYYYSISLKSVFFKYA